MDDLTTRIKALDDDLLGRSVVTYVSEREMIRALTNHGFIEEPSRNLLFRAISTIHAHGMQAREERRYGLLVFDHINSDSTFGYHVCRIGRYASFQ